MSARRIAMHNGGRPASFRRRFRPSAFSEGSTPSTLADFIYSEDLGYRFQWQDHCARVSRTAEESVFSVEFNSLIVQSVDARTARKPTSREMFIARSNASLSKPPPMPRCWHSLSTASLPMMTTGTCSGRFLRSLAPGSASRTMAPVDRV
jgi:hypothetical protein